MEKRTKFRLGLLLLFTLGIFLMVAPWEHWLWFVTNEQLRKNIAELVSKVGDAFAIAPILALVIEIAAAQELLENFAREVSVHILGSLLPPELRSQISDHLRTHFIKKRWDIEYRIEEWPGHPEVASVRTTVTQEVENRSGRNNSYEFRFEVEKSWFPSIAKSKICHATGSTDDTVLFEFNPEKASDWMLEDDIFVKVKQKIAMPPMPHTTYRFTAESEECLPIEFDAPFITFIPVVTTIVVVRYDKKKLKVELRTSYQDEQNPPQQTELIDGTRWVISTPMLPGQCFFTRWSKVQGVLRTATAGVDQNPETNAGPVLPAATTPS